MLKVLIVDDEPFILQGLKVLIDWEGNGFTISGEATNGKEAIALMENNQYDLVITDVRMPQMNGIELIEYIRKAISTSINIIVLSGYYEFEYAKQAIKYGVVDYVLKPVQTDELIRILSEFKERYLKEVARSENALHTERVILEGYLNTLCSGMAEPSSIRYIKEKLEYHKNVRYIMLEIGLEDESLIRLSEEERKIATYTLYMKLREYIAPYESYILLDVDKRNESYGVGFIYAKQFSDEKRISEKEYMIELRKAVKIEHPYRFYCYVGEQVEDIEELATSFKSVIITRSFYGYKHNQDITYYEETNTFRPNSYGIKKEDIDELLRYTEENSEQQIDECIERIYAGIKEYNIEPQILNININYLLCRLFYLAKELDSEVNQEEVLHYISESAFNQLAGRRSVKQFKGFIKDFAHYLAQLRQSNSHIILKEVEREIELNYRENLSLKSLGEKYYINSAYLGQIFKKHYGVSFKDYLNNYRLERACEMLIRTNNKVCYVAENVGYNNLDYFINKFVRLKGKTPLQYRKQFLK